MVGGAQWLLLICTAFLACIVELVDVQISVDEFGGEAVQRGRGAITNDGRFPTGHGGNQQVRWIHPIR